MIPSEIGNGLVMLRDNRRRTLTVLSLSPLTPAELVNPPAS
jgi:hypothetical protein